MKVKVEVVLQGLLRIYKAIGDGAKRQCGIIDHTLAGNPNWLSRPLGKVEKIWIWNEN